MTTTVAHTTAAPKGSFDWIWITVALLVGMVVTGSLAYALVYYNPQYAQYLKVGCFQRILSNNEADLVPFSNTVGRYDQFDI